jgi:hypothetical protein
VTRHHRREQPERLQVILERPLCLRWGQAGHEHVEIAAVPIRRPKHVEDQRGEVGRIGAGRADDSNGETAALAENARGAVVIGCEGSPTER